MRLGNLAVVEAYVQVSSEGRETREEFYQELLGHIAKAKGMTKSLILLGDFNGHVDGYIGSETNSNGEMMLGALKEAKPELLPING